MLQRSATSELPLEATIAAAKTIGSSLLQPFSQKKFEGQMLVAHNEYRALHRAPPLRLNVELSSLAQQWAEALAAKDKMAHDPKCGSLGLGENVAMKFRRGFTAFPGDIFTELWYHEIDQYRWTGEDQLACGHFTQLVWRSSTEVGFGRAIAKSGRVYVVGRYKPPGNYSGQFGRNVLPPTRVMPRSRNNLAAALDSKRAADDNDEPKSSAADAKEPAEYAGFGTARVADSRGFQAVAHRQRPVTVAASRAGPSSGEQLHQHQMQPRQKSTVKDPSVQKNGS